MATSDTWSKTLTYKLIKEYEAKPELWLSTDPNYKNRDERALAMRNISLSVGIQSNEVVRKLHNLRCQFNAEIRKIKKHQYGRSNEEIYKSKWEFFDALKFMSASNEDNLNVNSFTKSESIVPDSEVTIQSNALMYQELSTPNWSRSGSERSTDEYQIFGDFVAQELRSIKCEDLRRKLKRLIQRDILLVLEEEYSTSSSPVVSSLSKSPSQSLFFKQEQDYLEPKMDY